MCGVLLSAPTMVKTQSIHRAIHNTEPQSFDSKLNNEQKRSNLTQIIATVTNSVNLKNLGRKEEKGLETDWRD